MIRSKIMTAIIVLLCVLIVIGIALFGYMLWAAQNGILEVDPNAETASTENAVKHEPQQAPLVLLDQP